MAVVKEMSLDELKETVSDLDELERITFDARTGNGQFKFEGGRIVFDLRMGSMDRYYPTLEAYTGLAHTLGVPGTYVKKTPHRLMIPHVNFWLEERGGPDITLSVRDDKIESFTKGAIAPYPNRTIINEIEAIAGPEAKAHHVSHSFFRTSYSISSPRYQSYIDAVEVGDIVHGGVRVENSYAKARPVEVSAYVHRLICTNGAISSDSLFRMTRQTSGVDMDEWVINSIENAFNGLEEEYARLNRLKEITFDGHLSDNLVSVFSEFSVPVGVRDRITDMILDNTVVNLYDLYNTVTYIASNDEDVLENPTLSSRLMKVGGRIAAHPEFCDGCHRLMLN